MARVQSLLALLASTHLAIAQNGSHFKTIPVYPSPKDVVAATNDFKLTLEEKSSLVDGTDGPCGGNIAPIPRLNFKGICLQDSPLGVREADFVTIFSAGITAGASFDRAMIRERGLLMAEEFRAKGINIAWSSNIDDRTMHELYMWSFADGIRAGADHAMCSYQLLNQTHACANSKALNGLLKGELGLQGSILSDWFATHSGVSSINAGLDLNMPGGWASPYFMNMSQYVENGDVSDERLDDMVRRILTPDFRYKQNSPDYPALDLSLNEFKEQETAATGNTILLPATPEEIPMWNIGGTKNRDVRKDHGKFVRELGAAGAVLLKNDADLSQGQFELNPIDPIGPEMGANAQGSGSGTGRFSYFVSPLQAIKERMGSDLVQYILDNKAIASNIGSICPAPEACLVFVKSHIGEATDRETLGLDWDGNAIIDTVSQKCNNTIVVTHTGGPNNMPWADNPNVTAIIAGHLPGQEIGHSIADILWGDLNPSGKLPYTIAHNESDYNASVVNLTGSTGIDAWQSDFTEGLYTDYRHFNESDIEPLYEFGFGLSYTTFSVKLGSVTKLVRNASPMPLNRPTQPGGNPALFEPLVKVTITVRNTGKLAVATVPQLYLSLPDSAPRGTPVKVLRGFDKTKKLSPNQSQKISFVLTRKDMSFWDVTKQDWLIPKGRFSIKVGFSSRDLPVEGSVVF
ncbi:hypothetical protein FOXG_13018 [Fusarium oxysporum f. sp. lycopersici 4287]|uniref:Probable beta-glucosidase G n=2 Tax=Fusarium oxysporum TaxID=5507 RepID=A0A0J9VS92_FUSO4|nr:hypothetical protein FOXG_13018 [Fusarium oxysporum f. sp. lycopersici 4287]KNB13540.1 hypothetical protein FOXG_13018 [Fusarium oxysporum f. sp. lycopersici 4287]